MKQETVLTAKPKNMHYLRNANRAAILKRLAVKGPASRITLSRELGLTKMAISTIVSELMERNLMEECGSFPREENAASGRKPTALSIPDRRINALGLFIVRHKMVCTASDIKGNRFCTMRADLPENTDNALLERLLVGLIGKVLSATEGTHYIGIGIASIGPLDIKKQMILNPPNFRRIGRFPIGGILRDNFDLPVFLDNDMNADVLGEQLYGLGKNMRDMVYLGFGTGVGAGIVTNGHMLHGNGGFAGELGHISIQMDGPLCSCGRRGCLETYTSVPALLERTGAASVQELAEAVRGKSGTERLLKGVEEYFRAVDSALVTVANTFDPQIIILGDEGSLLAADRLQELEQNLNAHMFQHGLRHIRLAVASFGEATPLVGASSLVFEKVFRGELPLF